MRYRHHDVRSLSLLSIDSLAPATRQQLLDFYAHSVITLTFGAQIAIERMLRLVHRAYTRIDISYDVFLNWSTRRVERPHGVPSDSIAFYAYDSLKVHPADLFVLYPAQSGWPEAASCCVIDVFTDNPSLVIPSRLFIPHEGTGRMEAFLQRTDMLPIFFTRTDGRVGVRIDSNANFDMLWDVPTRISALSLKVVLHVSDRSLSCHVDAMAHATSSCSITRQWRDKSNSVLLLLGPTLLPAVLHAWLPLKSSNLSRSVHMFPFARGRWVV